MFKVILFWRWNTLGSKEAILFEGMKELLEDLHKRYKVALILNTTIFETSMLEKWGVKRFFDVEIFSWKIGTLKLNPENYKEGIQQLEVALEECVVIDDQEKNVIAAQQLGMKGIVFKDVAQLRQELEKIDPEGMKFISPETFRCTKCGECCRPIVKVSESEVQRIEETGRKRKDFLAYDPGGEKLIKKDTLKQQKGVCIFLKKKGEEFICSIYDHRPDTCRKYPFVEKGIKLEDCRPKNWKYWMPIEGLIREE